jgi:hypothetical protein
VWRPLLGERLHGYGVDLTYPRGGETFRFPVDPAITSFLVPPHAAPPRATPASPLPAAGAAACAGRDDLRIAVVAETARGEAPVWGLWRLGLCSGYPSTVVQDPIQWFGTAIAAELPTELRAATLQLPTLAHGAPCPISGVPEPLPGFPILGAGPVGLAIAPEGVLTISGGPNADGWHGAKALWVVTDAYAGPVRIRGRSASGASNWMARTSSAS